MISADVWPVALFGPEQHEEVRKSRHHDRAERFDLIRPDIAQARAVAAGDVHVVGDVERPEARGFDDYVDAMQRAGRIANAVAFDSRNAIGHQVHVVAIECRQVVVGDAAAFATRLVVRRQARAQFRVFYGQIEMFESSVFHLLPRTSCCGAATACRHVHHQPQAPPIQAHQPRHAAEQRASAARECRARGGEHPRGRALKHGHVGGVLCDFRQHLHGARASADDRHASSRADLASGPIARCENVRRRRISMPSIAARFGRCNPPSPLTTTFAVICRPSCVSTCQRLPSNATLVTLQRNRIFERRSYLSTQRSQ